MKWIPFQALPKIGNTGEWKIIEDLFLAEILKTCEHLDGFLAKFEEDFLDKIFEEPKPFLSKGKNFERP